MRAAAPFVNGFCPGRPAEEHAMNRFGRIFALACVGLAAILATSACDAKSGPGEGGENGLSSALGALSSALAPGDSRADLGPNVSQDASAGDSLYKPHSNVENQAALARDAAESSQALSRGSESLSDVRAVYENGKNAPKTW